MVCCDEPRSLFSTSKAPPVQNIMSFYLNKSFLQKKLLGIFEQTLIDVLWQNMVTTVTLELCRSDPNWTFWEVSEVCLILRFFCANPRILVWS